MSSDNVPLAVHGGWFGRIERRPEGNVGCLPPAPRHPNRGAVAASVAGTITKTFPPCAFRPYARH